MPRNLVAVAAQPAAVVRVRSDGALRQGCSVVLHEPPDSTVVWGFRLSALFDSWAGTVAEFQSRIPGTQAAGQRVLATAWIPGARGYELRGWAESIPQGQEGRRATMHLGVGPDVGAHGVMVDPVYAQRYGERPVVSAGTLTASDSDVLVIPTGGRLRAYTLWSSGVGNATVSLGALVVTCPQDGAISGRPDLPGPLTVTFATPAGVTGGWLAEYTE